MKASIARAVAAMTVWALLSAGCGSSDSPESDFAMSARVNGASWEPDPQHRYSPSICELL